MVMNRISKLLSLNTRGAHIARLTLPIVLLASTAAFAAGGESEAIAAYLASKQVVASQDLASQIASSGQTSCTIAFVPGTAQLARESKAQIEEIARMLRDDEFLKVELSLGASGAVAVDLSHRRAIALARELHWMGVPKLRVQAKPSNDPTAVAFNELQHP
jgi:hypothetical protein